MNKDQFHALRSELTIDKMRELVKGYLPEVMGIELIAIKPGSLQSRLMVRPNLLAPNGFLHAATIIGLADTTCGFATMAHLPNGAESFTTIELKTNFLGTAREGAISCESRVEHSGRTTQVWDAVVVNESSGQTIALFRCTQMILWPKV